MVEFGAGGNITQSDGAIVAPIDVPTAHGWWGSYYYYECEEEEEGERVVLSGL
jgi:hypothetical protein